MRNLTDRLRITKAILRFLSWQPASRSELTHFAIKHGGSYASFNALLDFAVTSGYVEKSGPEHRAPYRITEKGLKMLEAL